MSRKLRVMARPKKWKPMSDLKSGEEIIRHCKPETSFGLDLIKISECVAYDCTRNRWRGIGRVSGTVAPLSGLYCTVLPTCWD